MFRKTIITLAAAVSMSASAFAQYAPQQPNYPQQGGYGQAPSQYPTNQGGYGGDVDPGFGSGQQDPRGGYQPAGYDPRGQNQTGQYQPNNYPNGPQQPGPAVNNNGGGGATIDLRSAQPGRSQMYRYMLPQGWKPMETNTLCLIMAPDGSMAYGVMAPGSVQGNLSADAYMKDALTRVAQFQNIQVLSGQRGQVQAPFTESGCFMVTYSYNGQPFVAMINCAVAQNNGSTYGMMQVIFGTQQAVQANGQPLMQLLQSVQPMGQQNNGPVNNGPVNNGPVNNGPVNNGPVNIGPVNSGPVNSAPTNYPPMNNGPTPTPNANNGNPSNPNAGSVNPLER